MRNRDQTDQSDDGKSQSLENTQRTGVEPEDKLLVSGKPQQPGDDHGADTKATAIELRYGQPAHHFPAMYCKASRLQKRGLMPPFL